jgi:hypothetical protein
MRVTYWYNVLFETKPAEYHFTVSALGMPAPGMPALGTRKERLRSIKVVKM